MLVSCIIPTLNEEEQIGFLIDTIFKQDYRPVEVLVVDGGSKDRTKEIVSEKRRELNSEKFNIKILFENDFGKISSPANARNIGIGQSAADYLILLDADIFFIEKDSLRKVKAKLDEVRFCCVRTKPIIDSELEYQIALGDIWHVSLCAFRKEVFINHRFNPELGLGEDEDFWFRSGVNFSNVCETTLGRHFPHTVEEYKKQQIWYGKSYLNYMKIIIKEQRHLFWKFFRILVKNTFYLFIPILLIITIFFSRALFLFFISLLLATFLFGLYKSPEKNAKRLFFLIWRSFFEARYFMQGLTLGLKRHV
ncbi:Glycosyltransferase AglE [uncultured archaeon]|nr:Glycosyltransferase AglE [uncultured archaeon]